MENYDSTTECTQTCDQTKSILKEAAKWAKIIAIIDFVVIGFMVLAGLMMFMVGDAMDGMVAPAMGTMMGIMYLVTAAIIVIPTLYLLNFSRKTVAAIDADNKDGINLGLDFLKKYFQFMAIMAMVCIAIVFLAFIVAMIAGAASVRAGM